MPSAIYTRWFIAFRQPGADGPGEIIGVQAALYHYAAALVFRHELFGLLGCAIGMMEPGMLHPHHPAKLMS